MSFRNSDSDDGAVRYGRVNVYMPKDFSKEFATGNWSRFRLSPPETKIKIIDRNAVPDIDFFKRIGEENLRAPGSYVLIFVHGYQTSFDQAAQRAAAIGYMLKSRTTAFFSWPSRATGAGYLADLNAAEASSELLAKFLVDVYRTAGAAKVHIVAHSMGNFALLRALQRPTLRTAVSEGLRFGQVILAAPDVDSRQFALDSDLYKNAAERVTLYASKSDVALIASKKASDFSRVGLLPPIATANGIDTLDVSYTNLTMLGHDYVASEIAVLEDMREVIVRNTPPKLRRRIVAIDGGKSWALRYQLAK